MGSAARQKALSSAPEPIPNARADEEAAAVWVDIAELRPWADNPRFNQGRPVDVVADSIRLVGWGRPLGACRGQIVWGHTARLAALKLCAAWTTMSDAARRAALASDDAKKRWHPEAVRTAETGRVPVRFRNDLTDRQAEQLALADNRTNELAEWDVQKLLDQLGDFDTVEVEAMGWNADDLKKMADDLLKSGGDAGGDAEQDEVPEAPKDPVTRLGDVWILGDHVLVCGDSTQRSVWASVMDGARDPVSLVITDPPYGVDYVGKTADALPVHNDGAATLPALLSGAFDAVLELCRDGACWYVFSPPGPNMGLFGGILASRELWRQTIIWAKDAFVLGHNDFHYQHEPIFYGWKPGTHRPTPDRKQTSLWTFDRPKASRDHPTMKPVPLIGHAIGMSSVKGDIVADPFAGSGTTLIACEQLGRPCRTVEVAPEYCDVIVERWQNLTGGKATRRAA